jgi:GDPmannose 4,6-dehydratase
LMLQHATPDDYVIATGETHTVREFCDLAFASVGLDYRDYVRVDRANFRLPDTTLLVGNPTKAKRLLGWMPTVTFPDLVQMMVAADLMSVQKMQQSAPLGVTNAQTGNLSTILEDVGEHENLA